MFSPSILASQATGALGWVGKWGREKNRGCKMAHSSSCVFCDRPLKNGGSFCEEHRRLVERERARAKANSRERAHKDAHAFIHYRGVVVAMVRCNGHGLKPVFHRFVKPTEEGEAPRIGVPKRKLIDLDGWVDGFSRDQVKALKRAVLRTVGF